MKKVARNGHRGSAETNLSDNGIELPSVPESMGTFVPAVETGGLLYVSGQLSLKEDGSPHAGVIGRDVTPEEGYQYARRAGLGVLAAARQALGSLDRVVRVVKLNGYVNAVEGFTSLPSVINGASDLMVEVFGERGRHARAAVGVAELPANAPVEVEAILQVSKWRRS